MATIIVPTVRLIHNFKFMAKYGHNPNNVYKIGSISKSSRRISTEKISPKMEAIRTIGYNIVHKIPWVTKVYTFPFPGYSFGHIRKSWTQFMAG